MKWKNPSRPSIFSFSSFFHLHLFFICLFLSFASFYLRLYFLWSLFFFICDFFYLHLYCLWPLKTFNGKFFLSHNLVIWTRYSLYHIDKISRILAKSMSAFLVCMDCPAYPTWFSGRASTRKTGMDLAKIWKFCLWGIRNIWCTWQAFLRGYDRA